jgi:hypothetical protein
MKKVSLALGMLLVEIGFSSGCSPISAIDAAKARGDYQTACAIAQKQSHTPEGAVSWADCLQNGSGGVTVDKVAALQYLNFAARSGNNAAAQQLQSQGETIPKEYFQAKDAEQLQNQNTPVFINGPGSCNGAWGGRWGYYGGRLGYGCW